MRTCRWVVALGITSIILYIGGYSLIAQEVFAWVPYSVEDILSEITAEATVVDEVEGFPFGLLSGIQCTAVDLTMAIRTAMKEGTLVDEIWIWDSLIMGSLNLAELGEVRLPTPEEAEAFGIAEDEEAIFLPFSLEVERTILEGIYNTSILNSMELDERELDARPTCVLLGEARLTECIARDLDLSRCVFAEDFAVVKSQCASTWCESTRFLSDVEFDYSTFSEPDGMASFAACVFFGSASFEGTVFDVDTFFDGAQFHDFAWFYLAEFRSFVDFKDVRFEGFAEFEDVKFVGPAWFDGIRADNGVSFMGVDFLHHASFIEAHFESTADFDGVHFDGDANFTGCQFIGSAMFVDVLVSGFASFNGSTFNASADFLDAHFQGSTDFSHVRFVEDSTFNGAHFYGFTEFVGARFEGFADFLSCTFDESALFDEAVFLSDVAISARFGGQASFDSIDATARFLLYDTSFRTEAIFENVKIARAEDRSRAYFLASRGYDSAGYRSQSDIYYRKHMIESRSTKNLFVRGLEIVLVGWTSGYGTKWENVLFTWLIVILLGALVLWLGKGIQKGDDETPVRSFWLSLYFSIVTFTTLGYGDYRPRSAYKILAGATAMTGAFMLALFVLIFSHSFMR